jgi:hypothetical protein
MKAKKRSLDEITADIKALLGRTEVEEALLRRKAKTAPARPKRKRGLPNQHERLTRDVAFSVRSIFGACPACRYFVSGSPLKDPAVIYRRSPHSITFKCKVCSLQWTITHANLHRAAAAIAQALRDCGKEDYECSEIAAATKLAAEREAKRRNTITRQRPRRVIPLGNGER